MNDRRETERLLREHVHENHPLASPYEGEDGNLLDLQAWHVRQHDMEDARRELEDADGS